MKGENTTDTACPVLGSELISVRWSLSAVLAQISETVFSSWGRTTKKQEKRKEQKINNSLVIAVEKLALLCVEERWRVYGKL